MHSAVHNSNCASSSTSSYRNCNRLSVRSPISRSIKSTGRIAASAVSIGSPSLLKRMASVSASTGAGGGVGYNGSGDSGHNRYSSSYIRGTSSYCRSNSIHRSRAPSLAIIKALQQQQQSQQHLQQQQHHHHQQQQQLPTNMTSIKRKISGISQVSINGIPPPSIDDQASGAMSDQLSINLSILLDGKIDWRVKLYRLQLKLLKYLFVFLNSFFIATSVYLLFISNNSSTNLWIPDNSLIILSLMFGIILSGIAVSGALKEELYLIVTYSIIFSVLLSICYAYYSKQLTSYTIQIVFIIYLIICYYYCYILYLKPSPAILPDGTLITPKEQIVLNSIKRKNTRRQSSLTSGQSTTGNGNNNEVASQINNGNGNNNGVSGKKTSSTSVMIINSSDIQLQSIIPSTSTNTNAAGKMSKSSVSESDIPRRTSNLRTASVNFVQTFWPASDESICDKQNLPS